MSAPCVIIALFVTTWNVPGFASEICPWSRSMSRWGEGDKTPVYKPLKPMNGFSHVLAIKHLKCSQATKKVVQPLIGPACPTVSSTRMVQPFGVQPLQSGPATDGVQHQIGPASQGPALQNSGSSPSKNCGPATSAQNSILLYRKEWIIIQQQHVH